MPHGRRAPRVTYHTPPPIHIGRFQLVSPRMRVETRADGQVTTSRAPRNPIVVGSVVTVHTRNPIRSQFMDWRPGNAGRTNWMPSARRRTLALVTDMSPDGRLFEYMELAPNTSHMWNVGSDGRLTPRDRAFYPNGSRFSYYGASTFYGRGDPVTQSELDATVSPLESHARHVARIGHIETHVDPAVIEPLLIQHLRRLGRQHAVQGMYDRLTEAVLAGRTSRYFHLPRASIMSAYLSDAQQKKVVANIKRARSYLEQGNDFLAGQYLTEAMAWARNRFDVVRPSRNDENAAAEERMRTSLAKAVSNDNYRVEQHTCGHTTFSPVVGPTRNHYGVVVGLDFNGRVRLGSACPDCVHNHVRPFAHGDYRGEALETQLAIYRWSDRLYRIEREPSIIGDYHSSKSVVGYVAPLQQHKGDWPTIGFELEVQRRNEDDSNDEFAQDIRGLVAEAMNVDAKDARKYLNFEYDGSVDNGFEMVSGWTDLATHARIMQHVLQDENNRNRWVGKLRSHNASCSCGLHVHIQKPKSLVHASKIRYFMSSPTFKEIVKAVARRYNAQYARIAGHNNHREPGGVNHCDFDHPEKCAALHLKARKHRFASDPKGDTRDIVRRMQLNEDRYEHVNFQNSKTVEFRVFRGTTVFGTFMACLEMTQAVWMYCRDTPASAMSVDSFMEFINKPSQSKDTRHLRKLLASKGFAARVAKPPKGTVPVLEEAEA